jgi:CCR4-NOT transcription complex subunit 1
MFTRSFVKIIVPVVERSVTIASISSRELVAKDFATEPNEDRMRKAAHLMVQYLAGNLALVTCREPLRSNMVTHLRHLLNEQGFTEVSLGLASVFTRLIRNYAFQQVVTEHALMLIVTDNIDIACATIEKAAMERAVAEVDDAFSMAYADRRLHREVRITHTVHASINNHR